jgi:autotransporter-associated beta strand protein
MWTTLTSLWLALSGKAPHARTPLRRRPPSRPFLEPLEDRLAPATTLTWTGSASQSGLDPDNWAEHRTPRLDPLDHNPEYFDLVFPRGPANKQCDFTGGGSIAANSITFFDDGYIIKGQGTSFIDLGKPGITSAAASGTNTIEPNLSLDEEETNSEVIPFDIRSNNELRVTGDIINVLSPNTGTIIDDIIVIPPAPPKGLRQTGAGTLFLSGYNEQSSHILENGTLIVGNNHALGVGALKLLGGTLEAAETFLPVTLANPVDTFNGTMGGSHFLSLTGSVQIPDGTTLTVANTRSYVMFDNIVFGKGKLIKTGTGTMYLNAANTYEGGTEVSEGFVGLTNDGALGKGGLNLKGGIVEASFTTFSQHGEPLTIANDFVVSGGTISSSRNTFTLTGNGTLDGQLAVTDYPELPATITFSGSLGGTGSLTTTDQRTTLNGTVVLSGTAANTYTGATTVNSGRLVLSKSDGIYAIGGPLIIGDGEGGEFSDVVDVRAAFQLPVDTPLDIRSSGFLKLNNFDQGFDPPEGEGHWEMGDPPTVTVGFSNRSATFAGVISGPGNLVKVGTGTWTLTGANTFTGSTTVRGGALLVNGSLPGPVTVEAGATLGGTGTTGPVTLGAGAVLSPGGAGPALQGVQDLVLSPESSYVVQLNGRTAGSGYDRLDVTGTVQLNGATLSASLGFSPDPGDTFVIINNDGTDPVDGAFAGLPQGAVVRIGGVAFHIYYDRGDGNDVALVRNTPPAVTRPGDQTAFQNVDLALGGVRVGDPEDATLTVTLQVSHGTLTVAAVAGLTVAGNGTSSVSLSGSQAALNAVLAGLVYQALHNYSGPDVLTVKASDGLEVTSAGVAIRVKSLAEQAADLQAQVGALRDAGLLNQGRANSLRVKLELRDNHGDIGRVQAFLNEVDAFLRAGILSPAQADALRGAGNVLLFGLRRR